MLARIVHIGSPSKLRLQDRQLVVEQEGEVRARLPIEDLGIIVIDEPQVSFSSMLMRELSKANVSVLFCDDQHLPAGVLQACQGHTLTTSRVSAQISVSAPLRKQLWKQTVEVKIGNQAALLRRLLLPDQRLIRLATEVRSGDSSNREAAAAAYYWKTLFGSRDTGFKRDRYGGEPNNLLNYGYAILRSTVARCLVASGLLTMVGIHHRNSLNAFCLADDVMEPFRPFVDECVIEILSEESEEAISQLSKPIKQKLLQVLNRDVFQKQTLSPLQNAVARTCASLAACYEGEKRNITYATFPPIQ